MKQKITVLSGIILLAGTVFLGLTPYAPAELSLPTASPPVAKSSSGTMNTQPDKQPSHSAASSSTPSAPPAQRTKEEATIVENPATEEKVIVANGQRYPLRIYETLALPNDPSANQWWVPSTGLDTAWGYGTGSYTPLVAVIDTGFALKHQEFANRWYLNQAERGPTPLEAPSKLNCTDAGLSLNKSCNNIDDNLDGIVDNEAGTTTLQNSSRLNCTAQSLPLDKSCNRIDDDGNGLIDDVSGWDFSNFDNSVQAGEISPNGNSTAHGTMVTGILAATGNNNVGIAGVNWSAKILPLQAIDDNGYGNSLTIARSIHYAADQHADIINISLGTDFEDPYLREAIDYAMSAGSLIVAASGNDGCDCLSYPAGYPEVVAVGASNESGNPATFTSYGAELDLLAPGQNMTSPTWSASSPTQKYASGIAGTSFSAPYVTGLLALAKSHQPTANWAELTAALLEKSDRRALTAANPRSTTMGYGYAKADALIARVTTPTTPGLRYQFGPITPVDTLDTRRAYQCEGNVPATSLYELTSSNLIRYTTSKFALYKAQQAGWSKSNTFYVCIGLPNDKPATTREINLLGEIRNAKYKSWSP